MHGTIEDGVIKCYPGYTGEDCDTKICENNCNSNGQCVEGICHCKSGFSGSACELLSCLNECSGNGMCVKGVCACNVGFLGVDCAKAFIKHGKINEDGSVVCDEGWTGTLCEMKACSAKCGKLQSASLDSFIIHPKNELNTNSTTVLIKTEKQNLIT